jgi:iron complex transport system permease protein
VLLPVAVVLGRALDALSLGEEAATALGVRVGQARLGLIGVGASLAAVAVAATGPIGFVAFIAPHIARRLAWRTGAVVIPVAALSGAVLVVVADMVAARLLAPTQLPVGIVTSVLGAPFFLFLLYRAGRIGAGA